MIDALRAAIQNADDAREALGALTRKLSTEIEPSIEQAGRQATKAKANLGATLGAKALGECADDELAAARSEFAETEETLLGLENAAKTLHQRIDAASSAYRTACRAREVAAAEVARVLADQLRAEIVEHTTQLGRKLVQFAQIEERCRAGLPDAGGVLTGVALLRAAGNVHEILREVGVDHADQLWLFPEPVRINAEAVLAAAGDAT